MYTTLLMSTGPTLGSISALFGLTNKIINQGQYTVLVSVTRNSSQLSSQAQAQQIGIHEPLDGGPPRLDFFESYNKERCIVLSQIGARRRQRAVTHVGRCPPPRRCLLEQERGGRIMSHFGTHRASP
jgi:hypothetical protein